VKVELMNTKHNVSLCSIQVSMVYLKSLVLYFFKRLKMYFIFLIAMNRLDIFVVEWALSMRAEITYYSFG
jgi:hypothetical protein